MKVSMPAAVGCSGVSSVDRPPPPEEEDSPPPVGVAVGESPLTARETEVLQAAADGSSVAAIAGKLFLSEGTVRNHLSGAIGKTGASNRAEAVLVETENGWL